MLLIRALNEYDMISDPIKNGIASKKLLYRLTETYYQKELESIPKNEKEQFVKDHIKEYILSHKGNLEKHYRKQNKQYRTIINSTLDNKNPAAFIKFQEIMSTLQGHLNSGSRTDTNWISTSKTYSGVQRYYDKQDVHQMVLIKSFNNGIIDQDRVLTVDVSNEEAIAKNPYLCNKIACEHINMIAALSIDYPNILQDFKIDYVNPTNEKARGFSFSKASDEVCIYEYLPSDHILGLIEPLQNDLILKGLFNFNFYKLDIREQITYLNQLKRQLQILVDFQKDDYLSYLYRKLYIENRNIKSLITLTSPKERVIANKNKVLRLARNIPNIQIKR